MMEFTKLCAGKTPYGTGQKGVGEQLPHVNFTDPKLEETLRKPGSPEYAELMRTLVFLACCHTVVIDSRKGTYSAASPDELALVNAAKQLGIEFKSIDADDNLILEDTINGKTHKYK